MVAALRPQAARYMSVRTLHDPYRALIQRFNKHGVRYVVVGMAGINYYADTSAQAFTTMDYDVFINPTLSNVGKAIACLKRLGFTVGTTDGLLKAKDQRTIVRYRKTLVATTPDGLMVELLLGVSGYTFSDMVRNAAIFRVRGVPVKVARLTKLLRSKQVAGRAKDRQFLQRYQFLLEEES